MRLFYLTLVGVVCISLYGCASMSGRVPEQIGVAHFGQCSGCTEAPKKLLTTFGSYWTSRKEADFKSAYALEAPHIRLQFESIPAYAKFFSQGLPIEEVQVLSVTKRDENLYEFDIKLIHLVRDPALRESHYKDRWVRVGGSKYRHVLRTLFGFIE